VLRKLGNLLKLGFYLCITVREDKHSEFDRGKIRTDINKVFMFKTAISV